MPDLEIVEQFRGPGLGLGRGSAREGQNEGHVVAGVEKGQQVVRTGR